jgi:hypothetical protein
MQVGHLHSEVMVPQQLPRLAHPGLSLSGQASAG